MILRADKVYAERLREVTCRALGDPEVRLAAGVAEAAELLAAAPADLLLTGAEHSVHGNVVDFLARCLARRRLVRRVLVLTTQGELRLLTALRMLPIHGVFDAANDDPGNFVTALRTVAGGGRYWSPNITRRFSRTPAAGPDSLLRVLTVFEQLVLSVVGDGSDDTTAARELGLSPLTISTVRRHLHRKLGVQHRGELVRVAAQHGFVRFTPGGVVRPGFGLLTATYRARKRPHLSARGPDASTPAAGGAST